MSRHLAIATLSLALLTGAALAPEPLERNAVDALSRNPVAAAGAVEALRDAGPAGLEALFRVHERILAAGASHAQWARLCTVLDRVAAQRDARASRLYWHTDLDRARAEARASGKPILSLRLLGRLDQDLSCANSRMFRSVLYADRDVSAALCERFVLHWHSVRPVPTVRVDFGDGRVLERTLTGNSIHYVLDATGRVVEAIPGLWGPQGFLQELERAEAVARRVAPLDDSDRRAELTRYHAAGLASIDPVTVTTVAPKLLPVPSSAPAAEERAVNASEIRLADSTFPSALSAGVLTATKIAVERPLIAQLTRRAEGAGSAEDTRRLSLEAREPVEVRLDEGARTLIASKLSPHSGDTRVVTGARLARVVERLERNIARDQALNRGLQRTIHQWWAGGAALDDLETLNERVYAELFLTPASDPWLGLAPEDAYAGIDNQGLSASGFRPYRSAPRGR